MTSSKPRIMVLLIFMAATVLLSKRTTNGTRPKTMPMPRPKVKSALTKWAKPAPVMGSKISKVNSKIQFIVVVPRCLADCLLPHEQAS